MPRITKPIMERLMSRIVITAGPMETPCWVWTGTLGDDGYGKISSRYGRRGSTERTHKVTYEFMVGPTPEGLPHLDHLCRNRACCNPGHLEPVTQAENNRRTSLALINNGLCRAGLHPFSPPQCHPCKIESMRRWRSRAKSDGNLQF